MSEAKKLFDNQEKHLKELISLWKQAGRDTKRLEDMLKTLQKNRKAWEKRLKETK